MPDALPVSQMPNGIGDYISFNTSGADGSLLSQAKQLGGDMVGTAKKFLGIEDEKKVKEENYQVQFDTFKQADDKHSDIRAT